MWNIDEKDKHDEQFYCVAELMKQWLVYRQAKGYSIDGYINYTFTIILKTMFKRHLFKYQIENAKHFIHCIMSDFYLRWESYSKLQSGFGLLNCMRAEFRRRKWMTPQLSKWFNKTINEYYGYMAKYEDKKRESNGDV